MSDVAHRTLHAAQRHVDDARVRAGAADDRLRAALDVVRDAQHAVDGADGERHADAVERLESARTDLEAARRRATGAAECEDAARAYLTSVLAGDPDAARRELQEALARQRALERELAPLPPEPEPVPEAPVIVAGVDEILLAGPAAPARLAGRLGRHSLLYLAAAVSAVAAGLASVVVYTRFLSPAEFGRLALLLVLSSILMVIYNLGTLQGTFSWAFGGLVDDEGGDVGTEREGTTDSRRALMTGLALTLAVGVVGTGLVVAFSSAIGGFLGHGADDPTLVTLAGLAAAIAAVFRLASNAVRYQRRPGTYLVLIIIHHLLPIAVAVPLLVDDFGVEAVLIGLVVGNAVATVMALGCIVRDLRPAVSWYDARNIVRRGTALAPVVIAFNTIQLADALLLSRFVSTADLGVYRVASRIGALASYATSAYNMAWGPMRRDPLHYAVEQERGLTAVLGLMTTYFAAVVTTVLLVICVFATELARLASPAFAAAGGLIPLTAIGFAAHGVFVLVYRAADFEGKRGYWIRLAPVCAVSMVLASLVLGPPFGAYGVATAIIFGWSVGIVSMLVISARKSDALPYDGRRVAQIVGIAALLYGLSRLLPADGGPWLVAKAVLVLAYPTLLIAFDVIPLRHLAGVLGAVPSQFLLGSHRRSVRVRLRSLPSDDAQLLDAVVRQEEAVAAVAARLETDPDVITARVVVLLRELRGRSESRASDPVLGRLLLDRRSFTERQAALSGALRDGVDPVDADELLETVAAVRRAGPDDFAGGGIRAARR